MIKGAIFDLDGVIVNTVPLHFKAWQKMFHEYGHNFTLEEYREKVDGRPRLEGAAAILEELNAAEIEHAGERKQQYYLELLNREPIQVFEGTLKIIEDLKEKGIKLAAASSSKNAVAILKKIGLFETFQVNVSGADFKHGKPDPEIFLTATSRLKLHPKNCVVFEDAKSGVAAGIRGGFFVIGIDRHEDREALKEAHLIVKDLSEISVDDILKIGDQD